MGFLQTTIPFPLSILALDCRGSRDVAITLQVLLLLTVLTLAPAILVLVTSFTRTVIVLSLIRNALGTNQVPPNQVLVGLALFLTAFVMAPTFSAVYTDALLPYFNGELSFEEMWTVGLEPIRAFMLGIPGRLIWRCLWPCAARRGRRRLPISIPLRLFPLLSSPS